MIKDALVDYKAEEEKKKQEFLEEMEHAFYHIRKLLKWLEVSIHDKNIENCVLSGLVTSKIIIFFKEVFEEIENIKKFKEERINGSSN